MGPNVFDLVGEQDQNVVGFVAKIGRSSSY